MIGLNYWHWFSFALFLLILEVVASGGFLLWIGIAAVIVGGITWLIPSMGWPWQSVIFAIVAIGSCIVWWAYLKAKPFKTDQPALNRRSEQFLGRVFTLEEAVINGRGKIRIGDSLWQVAADTDLPSGTKVKVTAVDGVLLQVQPVISE